MKQLWSDEELDVLMDFAAIFGFIFALVVANITHNWFWVTVAFAGLLARFIRSVYKYRKARNDSF